jgi:hypothetical protein
MDLCRKKYVETKQKSIQYGFANPKDYVDVEADEVDLGKATLDGSDCVTWSQWADVVQRGYPTSFFLPLQDNTENDQAACAWPGAYQQTRLATNCS